MLTKKCEMKSNVVADTHTEKLTGKGKTKTNGYSRHCNQEQSDNCTKHWIMQCIYYSVYRKKNWQKLIVINTSNELSIRLSHEAITSQLPFL